MKEDMKKGGRKTLVTLLVFNLLGAALLEVGLFVTVPISVLMMASIDRQLSATAPFVGVG